VPLAEIYARLSPKLAHRPGTSLASRAHAWIMSRSGGRIARTLFGSPLLVLRTTGRRTGNRRESPMLFVEHENGYAVVASNAASRRVPAWWLNLQARPECEVFVDGGWRAARARAASDAEAAALWPRLDEVYVGFEHYRQLATRDFPVVILEPC
jgi:deazaflavin-dependent oxidoreductase (nitroreductase family)